jgi:CRP-like cAMP-binding protein/predicted acylesterase/phospholipase RssA
LEQWQGLLLWVLCNLIVNRNSGMNTSSHPRSPDELVDLIAGSSLFSSTDRSKLQQVADDLEWVIRTAGQNLFYEGDDVDSFYFLFEGVLNVSKILDGESVVLAEVEPGQILGEMQILTGGKRSATVSAKTDSGMVRFPRDAFDRFLASEQSIVEGLSGVITPRLYMDQLVKVLPTVFGELDKGTLQDINSRMTWKHLKRGHILCYQGEETDSFYILISGRMQVLIKEPKGNVKIVGEVAPGTTVGEMGVLTGDRRSATVIATRDSELARFSKQDFDDLTEQYPRLLRHMTHILVRRLQQANLRVTPTRLSSNMLIAPAATGAPLDDFTQRLRKETEGEVGASKETETCLLLSSEEVDRRMGIPGVSQCREGQPNDLRLRAWLSEQERMHRVILLQPDAEVTEWTSRCIRNADEVMYVAHANSAPETGAVAHEVQQQEMAHQASRRKALVLLHEAGVSRPSGTAAWLEEFGLINPTGLPQAPGRHFHVRRNHDGDHERLGRFVTRREVGLVLSGGGARGFAHVGCIRAMREQGIPIDMIAGVSMGSLVSAAYAFDPDKFDQTIERVKSQLPGVLSDVTPPMVSIARGNRFDQRLQGWFGDLKIEDLWMPYFCVTSNLTKAEIVAHDSGPLWWAVRASGTLPGISSPVVYNGDLLFDGCLLDNLPMDVMRARMYESRVVAVDVIPPHDLKVDVKNSVQSPSGWSLLWNKLNPFAKKIDLPNIFCIIQRAGELGSVYGRQRLIDAGYADLYMRPPVDNIHMAAFAEVDRSAQIGYEECGKQLAEWWQTVNQSDD